MDLSAWPTRMDRVGADGYLSHLGGSGLLGVCSRVNIGNNWLKRGSDCLLKGLSAFLAHRS